VSAASDAVTRFGGEEFAVILPKTELARAKELAERVRQRCESRNFVIRTTGQSIGKITASFGVAELREGEDPQMLVRRTDAKLYEAKSAGRNRIASSN
jgi:diguanylate cyclase